MSDSLITTLADAIADELTASDIEPAFTAERLYRPRRELADLADLKVSVVPRAVDIERATRAGDVHAVQIDVAVQRKLALPEGDSDTEIDELLGLVERIADHLRGRRPSACPDAAWSNTRHEPIYAVEHLDELRVFTSVLTLTYRVLR